MPPPAVWGPKLWAILHSIGARAGRSAERIRGDEYRNLKWLFEHLETVVPCPECKQHIVLYRRSHPLPGLCNEFSRWIWEFHEAVNERLGKPPGPPFPLPQNSEESILKGWKEYVECVRESVLKGALAGTAVQEFQRHLKLWYGFSS